MASRKEIADAAWDWVKFVDAAALVINRDALLALLKADEKEYFYNRWYPKEDMVVACYTCNYRNLGAATTQRTESMHPIVKAVMNP